MEILAENRFVMTKALFVEGRLGMTKESYGKAAKKMGIALLVLFAVLIAGSLLLRMSVSSVVMEVVFLALMSLWLFYLFPRSSAKQAYKALTKKWGDEPERTTRFFEDQLEIEGPGVHAFIPYDQIEQIRYTKRLLILITEEKGGVLLKLDGFKVGSEERVRELIGKHSDVT